MAGYVALCWRLALGLLFPGFILVAATHAECQQVQHRFALLIGNQHYNPVIEANSKKLVNPINDTVIIRQSLLKVGFNDEDIMIISDQKRSDIIGDLDAFQKKAQADPDHTVVFFYYSGHGGSVQENGKRRNFLLPVDEDVKDDQSLRKYKLDTEYVLEALSSLHARVTYIIFDACRAQFNLPATKGGMNTHRDDSFVEEAAPGAFVVYATDNGDVTYDDGELAKGIAHFLPQPHSYYIDVFQQANKQVAAKRLGIPNADPAELQKIAYEDVGPAPYFRDNIYINFCFVSCPNEDLETTDKVVVDFAPLRIKPMEDSYLVFPYLPKGLEVSAESEADGNSKWRKIRTKMDSSELVGYVHADEIAQSNRGGSEAKTDIENDTPAVTAKIDVAAFAKDKPELASVLASGANPELVNAILNNADLLLAGNIDTPLRFAHFFGQIQYESANFRSLTENLHYASGSTLMKIFPARFPDLATANAYAGKGAEAIANRIYANRLGNGDEASGDGWRYRGRGFFLFTGKGNYAMLSVLIGEDLVSDPDKLSSPDMAMKVAVAYWKAEGFNLIADTDDIQRETKLINGGVSGLDGRNHDVTAAKAWAGFLPWLSANPNTPSERRHGDRLIGLVQTILRDECQAPDLPVNGNLDASTQSALKAFQQGHALPQSGAIDDATLVALAGLQRQGPPCSH